MASVIQLGDNFSLRAGQRVKPTFFHEIPCLHWERDSKPIDSIPKSDDSVEPSLTTTMSIIKRLRDALRQEPQKTYVKAGITDESGALTMDGLDAYSEHLFDAEVRLGIESPFYQKVKALVDEDKK